MPGGWMERNRLRSNASSISTAEMQFSLVANLPGLAVPVISARVILD